MVGCMIMENFIERWHFIVGQRIIGPAMAKKFGVQAEYGNGFFL